MLYPKGKDLASELRAQVLEGVCLYAQRIQWPGYVSVRVRLREDLLALLAVTKYRAQRGSVSRSTVNHLYSLEAEHRLCQPYTWRVTAT